MYILYLCESLDLEVSAHTCVLIVHMLCGES